MTAPAPLVCDQHYLDCLSQASYLIGDSTTGQAVLVDPRRDVDELLADATAQGLSIVGIINTHFHADFAAGHLEAADRTGAWIGYGDAASCEYEIRPLADGERISLGEVTLRILHTPGHTPESISIVVYPSADTDTPYGVLTGDALFIGDVGRPDLLASAGVTADELGAMLYHSVHQVLLALPDETLVFPAHGAGSACGKNLSEETVSTIGEQRRTNYACQPMSEREFIDVVTQGQPPAPEYFAHSVDLNKSAHPLAKPGSAKALTAEEFDDAVAAGARIHDARDPDTFAAGHLAGAISVPFDGRTAETLGMFFYADEQVVVIAEADDAADVATRFARIGFDNVVGYLADPAGYFTQRSGTVVSSTRLAADATTDYAASGQLVDVRGPGEAAGGMLPGAVNIPLAQLTRRLDELDKSTPVVVYCAGGWRSSVAASALRAHGFVDVSDISGGYNAVLA